MLSPAIVQETHIHLVEIRVCESRFTESIGPALFANHFDAVLMAGIFLFFYAGEKLRILRVHDRPANVAGAFGTPFEEPFCPIFAASACSCS